MDRGIIGEVVGWIYSVRGYEDWLDGIDREYVRGLDGWMDSVRGPRVGWMEWIGIKVLGLVGWNG